MIIVNYGTEEIYLFTFISLIVKIIIFLGWFRLQIRITFIQPISQYFFVIILISLEENCNNNDLHNSFIRQFVFC